MMKYYSEMVLYFRNVFIGLIFILLSIPVFAQSGSTLFSIRVTTVYSRFGDETVGNNEFRFKIFINGGSHRAVIHKKGDPGEFPHDQTIGKFIPFGTAATIDIEAWEDDCGGNDNYNGCCELGCIGGSDDLHCTDGQTIDYTPYEPGAWVTGNKLTMCSGRYIVYYDYKYSPPTPPVPTLPFQDPICNGDNLQFIAKAHAYSSYIDHYEWQEATTNTVWCCPDCDMYSEPMQSECIAKCSTLANPYYNSDYCEVQESWVNLSGTGSKNSIYQFVGDNWYDTPTKVRVREVYTNGSASPYIEAIKTKNFYSIPYVTSLNTSPGTQSNNTFCYGENVTLTATDVGSDYIYIFERKVGTGSYEQIAETASNTWSDNYTTKFNGNFSDSVRLEYIVKTRHKNCNTMFSGYISSAPVFVFPAKPTISSAPEVTNETCLGRSDGKIRITGISGGGTIKKYSLAVKQGDGSFAGYDNKTISDGSYPTFTGLSPGIYKLQVGNVDSRGSERCYSESGELTIGTVPRVTASLGTISNVICNGGNTGVIPVTANFGNGTYIYSLEKNGSGVIAVDTTTDLSYTFTNLSAGDYKVRVTDGTGCPIQNGVLDYILQSINQPIVLSANALVLTPYNGRMISCWNATDGQITVNGINGNSAGTYSYSIKINNAGTYESLPSYPGDVSNVTGAHTFQNLPEGNYKLIITDCSGGNVELTRSITAPTRPVINTPVLHHVSCYGASNGYIEVDPTEGTGPYGFSLDNTNWRTSVASKDFIGGLAAGNYTLYMKDANNCDAVPVPFTIDQATPLYATFEKTMPFCYGGSDGRIKVKTSGGVPNTAFYQVNINGGTFEDVDPDSIYEFSDLPSGNHIISVRDRDSTWCFKSFTVFLDQPTLITIDSIKTVKPSCNGGKDGSITIKASNGTPGSVIDYYYSTDGINYYPPNDNGNFTTPDTLTAGDYIVFARDGNHREYNVQNVSPGSLCVGTATVTVGEPTLISISYSMSPAKCFGESSGAITVTSVTGGRGNYSYSWEADNSIIPGEQGPVLDNVPHGIYKLIVADQRGCKSFEMIEVTQPLKALTIDSIHTFKETCRMASDGRILIEASGGYPPYFFKLDNGSFDGVSFIGGISAGLHTLTVRDREGCEISKTVKIETDTVSITALTKSDVSVKGGNDGYFTFSVQGGSSHSYSINNGISKTLPQFFELTAGKYLVSIFYNTTCKDTFSVVIGEPLKPGIPTNKKLAVFAQELVHVSCAGGDNGKVSTLVVGGTPPYTYSWSRAGETASEIDHLASAFYTVKVTDAWDSVASFTAYIAAPKPLELIFKQVIHPTCAEFCNGKIKVEANGGVPPYSYIWKGAVAKEGKEITDLCAGKYTLTVKDANNCLLTRDFDIIKPSPFFDVLPKDSISICIGQKITLDAGDQWKSYEWSSSKGVVGTNRKVTLDAADNYFITVTSIQGCTFKDTLKLHTSSSLLEAKFLTTSEVVKGDTVAFIDVSWPSPDSIKWECDGKFIDYKSDLNSKQVIFPQAGTYTIKLTVALGECKDHVEKTITVFEPGAPIGIPASVLGYSGFKEFKLFPNPNTGQFTIDVVLETPQVASFTVHNIYGDSLFEATSGFKDHHIQEVNLTDLVSGVYMVLVQAGKETKSIRFLVH